jgi:hypothetical protein
MSPSGADFRLQEDIEIFYLALFHCLYPILADMAGFTIDC